MNTIATATRLLGEIKNFSQGEQESAATTAVQASVWNQLLEELENFKAKLASLEQEYATYREQSQKEIRFLKEKIATLEANAAGQVKKNDKDRGEILFLREKIASQNTKIAALDMAVAGQDKKIVILETNHDNSHKETLFLKEKIAVLETTHDKDIERLALEAAYDRQRVAKLEQKEPQPLQKDRGDILRSLIATNGGKMLAKYARLKMHLDKATFSRLLGTLSDHVTRKVHQLMPETASGRGWVSGSPQRRVSDL
jgi:chromosome segregation ATPase